MRQVPLFVGNGRLARHLKYYFTLLHLPFFSWHRNKPLALLYEQAKYSSIILLLINDQAIESFISKHLLWTKVALIHCSGSLASSKAFGAHPLMTFGEDLYTEEIYRTIPFIIDDTAPPWHELFPGLPNTHFRINNSCKAKYHALCVLSGNFSCMLWQKLFQHFETELNLPASVAHPFLIRQMQNLLKNYTTSLTGPLMRQDKITIAENLRALAGDPFQTVYQSFVDCYHGLRENS